MADNFKTFVIVNPHSANGRTGKRWPEINDALKSALGSFDHALTSKPMEAPELARNALAKGFEMIVSVGGDGNNNEVVNGFFDGGKPINPDAVFGIIPGGTGGDLARLLGIRGLPIGQVAATLQGRDAVRSDAGIVRCVGQKGEAVERYFINIADLGIGGESVNVVNNTTKALGGRISFLIGSLRTSLAYKNKRVKFRVDDGPEEEGKYYLITAAIGQYFGGGMRIAPKAVHNDGLFDIMVLEDLSFGDTLALGTKIYSGAHLGMPKIKLLRGKKLTATSDEVVRIDADGEEPGILPATFEILPGAVRMKQLKV